VVSGKKMVEVVREAKRKAEARVSDVAHKIRVEEQKAGLARDEVQRLEKELAAKMGAAKRDSAVVAEQKRQVSAAESQSRSQLEGAREASQSVSEQALRVAESSMAAAFHPRGSESGGYFAESSSSHPSESSRGHSSDFASEASEAAQQGSWAIAPWHNPQLAEQFDDALRRSRAASARSSSASARSGSSSDASLGFSAPSSSRTLGARSGHSKAMVSLMRQLRSHSQESAAALSVGLYGHPRGEESAGEEASESSESARQALALKQQLERLTGH